MIKAVYSLVTAVIVTTWGYFGQPEQGFARHRSPEERERAIEKSTWTCQDCEKTNGVDRTRCRDCGTMRGYSTEKEEHAEDKGDQNG